MNFIPYTDEYGIEHYFDCSKVMFTLTQGIGGYNEDGTFKKIGCKVALDTLGQGFIIADEEPSSMVARIKEANGIG